MGLLDVLNGMQNGPRGPSAPSAPSDGKGGMSPMTMAILALLAWKAVKHFGGSQPGAAPTQAPPRLPGNVTAGLPGGVGSGGLSDMLKGGLGGLLAGGAAGSVLSGGLGDLLNQFQQKGHGDAANSWVSNGPNKQISPGDLANALGADQIELAGVAERHVARRTAQRPQPVPARCDQPPDAGWAAAERERIVRPDLTPRSRGACCAVSLHHCATEKGQQP